jgi:hypothetical protein
VVYHKIKQGKPLMTVFLFETADVNLKEVDGEIVFCRVEEQKVESDLSNLFFRVKNSLCDPVIPRQPHKMQRQSQD